MLAQMIRGPFRTWEEVHFWFGEYGNRQYNLWNLAPGLSIARYPEYFLGTYSYKYQLIHLGTHQPIVEWNLDGSIVYRIGECQDNYEALLIQRISEYGPVAVHRNTDKSIWQLADGRQFVDGIIANNPPYEPSQTLFAMIDYFAGNMIDVNATELCILADAMEESIAPCWLTALIRRAAKEDQFWLEYPMRIADPHRWNPGTRCYLLGESLPVDRSMWLCVNYHRPRK